MRSSLICILCASLFHLTHTNALKFKVEGRHRDLLERDNELSRREKIDGSSPLSNDADISYYATVKLNGQEFKALIDTGSADLWVAGTVSNAKDTGKTSSVSYAIGKVDGPIKTAEVDFSGYKVPNQAFLEVTPDDNGLNKKGMGLLGLGPHDNSNIYNVMKTTEGAPLLDTIFMQNTSTPNYLTVNLGRLEDPTDIFNGDISIGEIVDTPESFKPQGLNLDDVLKQPKLPVTIAPVRKKGDQHFTILIDQDGIIGPDNHSIPFSSSVSSNKNSKQAVAVVDTGFSLTQVPKSVADAFYSRLSGAEYKDISGVGKTWIIPCDQEVNITFVIGGVRYPMHPLDAAMRPKTLNLPPIHNSNGDDSCIGLFQPMSFDVGKDPVYDMILGMSFIRNVYVLFNFGDFIQQKAGNSTKRGDPYLQMMSTTPVPGAHTDFVKARLNGVDTTDQQTLGPNNVHFANPEDKKSNMGKIFMGLAIAAGCLAIIAFIITFLLHRRKKNARMPASTAAFFGGGAGTYARLKDDHHVDMQHTAYTGQPGQLYGNGGPGGHQSQPLYDPHRDSLNNPWDARH